MLFPAGGIIINQHGKGEGGGGTYHAVFNKYPINHLIWRNQRSWKVKKGQEGGVITINF